MLSNVQFLEELRIRREAIEEEMSRYKPGTMPEYLVDKLLAYVELGIIIDRQMMDAMEARLVWEEAVDEAVK